MSASPTRKVKRDYQARVERLEKKRKLVMVSADPSMLGAIMAQGTKKGVTAEGLPKDAVTMGWAYDPNRMAIVYYFGHETFKPVKQGDQLPIVEVVFTDNNAGVK